MNKRRMNKRTFFKLLASAAVSRIITPSATAFANEKLSNWSGNLTYGTDRLTEAASVEEVRSFVKSHARFKALGTRHCFNSIADSRDAFVSLKPMHEMVAVDSHARTATVEAGVTYGVLAPIWKARDLPYTIWLRFRTSRWQAPAAPVRMDPERATEILLRRLRRSSL
jgi:hypothetical protein